MLFSKIIVRDLDGWEWKRLGGWARVPLGWKLLNTLSHQITLEGDGKKYGIKISGDTPVVEVPMTIPRLILPGSDVKYGDWDPTYDHIEQREYRGKKVTP